jgi:hypothetical protein
MDMFGNEIYPDFDPEYTVDVPNQYLGDDEPPLTIELEKSGGGTVGNAYRGTWRYRVTYGGHVFALGETLDTPHPSTHEEAARLLADFLAHHSKKNSLDCEYSELRSRLCMFWSLHVLE